MQCNPVLYYRILGLGYKIAPILNEVTSAIREQLNHLSTDKQAKIC